MDHSEFSSEENLESCKTLPAVLMNRRLRSSRPPFPLDLSNPPTDPGPTTPADNPDEKDLRELPPRTAAHTGAEEQDTRESSSQVLFPLPLTSGRGGTEERNNDLQTLYDDLRCRLLILENGLNDRILRVKEVNRNLTRRYLQVLESHRHLVTQVQYLETKLGHHEDYLTVLK